MKKQLILACFLLPCLSVSARKVLRYCEVTAIGNSVDNTYTIAVRLGSDRNNQFLNELKKEDSAFKLITKLPYDKRTNRVDMLNYMADHGWEIAYNGTGLKEDDDRIVFRKMTDIPDGH